MERWGERGLPFDLIKNHLAGRGHFGKLNDFTLHWLSVNHAASRSSFLCSFEFVLAYINDLPFHYKNSKILIRADDTANVKKLIFFSGRFPNQQMDELKLPDFEHW